MPEQEQAAAPSARNAGNVIRWIAFLPGAVISFVLAQVILTFILAEFIGFAHLFYAASRAIIRIEYTFIGPLVFIWAGTTIAPTRQRRVAVAFFWVYIVLFLLVELFRAPSENEPVSHSGMLLTALAGGLCGLFIALLQIKTQAKNRRALAAPPLAADKQRTDQRGPE